VHAVFVEPVTVQVKFWAAPIATDTVLGLTATATTAVETTTTAVAPRVGSAVEVATT
jgi:hypothetical protein